jgi:hypothetical protein
LSFNGGVAPPVQAGWRQFVNTSGSTLSPENATNWGIGGEFAPTAFLQGLDIQATWYSVKINGLLSSFGNPGTSVFNQSKTGFSYIVPTAECAHQYHVAERWRHLQQGLAEGRRHRLDGQL